MSYASRDRMDNEEAVSAPLTPFQHAICVIACAVILTCVILGAIAFFDL